jgi:hypothetical protein
MTSAPQKKKSNDTGLRSSQKSTGEGFFDLKKHTNTWVRKEAKLLDDTQNWFLAKLRSLIKNRIDFLKYNISSLQNKLKKKDG